MNFRDMSAEEVLAVSAPIIDPGGNLSPILCAHILLEGPKAIIEESHEHLLKVQQKTDTPTLSRHWS